MSKKWKEANQWEQNWWGECINTLGEEVKQLNYANRMGLEYKPDNKTPYRFDLEGRSVLDVGGGPCSLLLRCVNFTGKIIDPLPLPKWVKERYKAAGINYQQAKAESMKEEGWDEVWLYNVLEHTDDPERIIKEAKKAGKLIRIFQWIDTGIGAGHIHTLKAEDLDRWLGGEGKVENFQGKANLWGKAYYGVFPT